MFARFKQRSYDIERLDTGDYTPAEYLRWQREMSRIHRVFGEIRALRHSLIREVNASREASVSILDVGAGSGELLRMLGKSLNGKKTFLAGVEIDMDAARSIRGVKSGRELFAVRSDALRLAFADDGFDYVFCTLFLHHLNDEQAVTLLTEMSRVARKKIFVIDLNRSPVAYYFYKIASRLFLQRLTREDGALSILRSFQPSEIRRLAERANLTDVSVQHSKANRLILSGRKANGEIS